MSSPCPLTVLVSLVAPAPPADPPPAVAPSHRFADFDGDGLVDLYAVRPGGTDRLYRNLGDGTFGDVTDAVGLAGIAGSRHALWLDFDGDGWLDLYVGAADGRSRLVRSESGAGFADVTAAAGVAHLDGSELLAECFDFDLDGWPDLRVVTRRADRLYRNLGDGRFREVDLGADGAALALPAPAAGRDVATDEPPRAQVGSSARGGGASTRASATTGGGGPPAPFSIAGAARAALCAGSIEDQAGGPCLLASATPTLGLLHPLSTAFNIDGSGRVGMGTTTPSEQLEVAGTLRATGVTTLGTFGTGGDELVVRGRARLHDTLRIELPDGPGPFGTGGLDVFHPHDPAEPFVRLSHGTHAWELRLLNGDLRVTDDTALPDALRLTDAGDVGLSTSLPEARLHVFEGSAGFVTADAESCAVLERNGDAFLSILAPSSSQKGLYFGDPTNNKSGAIVYDNPVVANGLEFRTNGNSSKMVITAAGAVGIGLQNPTFQLQLSQNSAAKPTSNTWTILSDARLKKNVEPLTGALDRLLQLRGVTFEWIDPASQGGCDWQQVGLIAQEVEEVFPHWVATGPDGYRTLTVSGFEALTAEALRDLRAEKDAQIAALEARLAERETVLARLIDRLDALEGRLP